MSTTSAMTPAVVTLRVLVLGLFQPQQVQVRAEGPEVLVRAQGEQVAPEGGPAVARLRLPSQGLSREGVTLRLWHRGQEVRRRYPGALWLSAKGGRLQLVNEVQMEPYVARVTSAEGGETARHSGAAQALAVVVRGFAAAAQRAPRHADADLCDLTHCQVYQGDDQRAPFALEAARATAGQVPLREGRPAEVYFTASCGGHSAAVWEVWGGPRRPHLGGQPCQEPPTPPWSARVPRGEVLAALQAGRLLPPGCTGLALQQLTSGVGGWGGRVRARCGPAADPGRELSAEALRMALGRRLGWARLPSSNFTLRESGDEVLFSGRGAGHGVGLCVAGAVARSAGGATAAQILRGAFPGTVLSDAAPAAEEAP